MKIPWTCKLCNASGEIDVMDNPETIEAEIWITLHGRHALASPECQSNELTLQMLVQRPNIHGVITGWIKP